MRILCFFFSFLSCTLSLTLYQVIYYLFCFVFIVLFSLNVTCRLSSSRARHFFVHFIQRIAHSLSGVYTCNGCCIVFLFVSCISLDIFHSIRHPYSIHFNLSCILVMEFHFVFKQKLIHIC